MTAHPTHTAQRQDLDASLKHKGDILFEHERLFANMVAKTIIPTPKLSLWMILIPVIFVFYFFQLDRCSKGRKAFVHNYLITRRKTLEEVRASLEEDRAPDIETLASSSDVPDSIRHAYKTWIQVLADHYATVLRARGASYEALVKAAFRTRKTYREALRRLNDAEATFNSSLKPLLPQDVDGGENIIAQMQEASIQLRKEQAGTIFA